MKMQQNFIFNNFYYIKCYFRNVQNNETILDFFYFNLIYIKKNKKLLGHSLDVNLYEYKHLKSDYIIVDYFKLNCLNTNNYGKDLLNSLKFNKKNKKFNSLLILRIVKGGAMGRSFNIFGFIPKSHLIFIIKTIKLKSFSKSLYILNSHSFIFFSSLKFYCKKSKINRLETRKVYLKTIKSIDRFKKLKKLKKNIKLQFNSVFLHIRDPRRIKLKIRIKRKRKKKIEKKCKDIKSKLIYIKIKQRLKLKLKLKLKKNCRIFFKKLAILIKSKKRIKKFSSIVNKKNFYLLKFKFLYKKFFLFYKKSILRLTKNKEIEIKPFSKMLFFIEFLKKFKNKKRIFKLKKKKVLMLFKK